MKPLILHGHTKPLTCVRYNASGDLLFTAAKDNVPTVWYTHNGERLGTFEGHRGAVWSICPSSCSTFVLTAGGDQTLNLYRLPSGQLLKSFELGGSVRCVEFSEGDNLFLATVDPFASRPAQLVLFSFDKNAPENTTEPMYCYTFDKKSNKFNVAIFSPCNKFIITGDDFGVIRVHETKTGEVVKTFENFHTKKVNSLKWNKEKTLLVTGSSDQSSLLVDFDYDTGDMRVLKKYVSNVPVNSAVMSPIKEHVLVAGGQEAMNVTTTSARVGKFETKFFHAVFADQFGAVKGHFGPVNTLDIHPHGIGFTSGAEDGYVRLHVFDESYYSLHKELEDLSSLEALAQHNK